MEIFPTFVRATAAGTAYGMSRLSTAVVPFLLVPVLDRWGAGTMFACIALALWLPQYLINVYGLDIKTAGMIAAFFSVPASLFRVYGGHLSDTYGARRVLYWTFIVSVVATFILSYPPTQYVVEGIRGPVAFSTRMSLPGFIITAFVLGFFMALGKAAVYKHIPVYYPKNVGSVGGLVGMIGGLGGFVGANFLWAFNERWSANVGGQFQTLGTYTHTFEGSEVKLDLSRMIWISAGVGYSF